MIRIATALLAAIALAGCAAAPPLVSAEAPAARSLDAIAQDYVRDQLVIGEREPGYVDAYYGPAEWAEAANADTRTLAELARDMAANRAALADLRARARGDAMWLRRVRFLDAQMVAAETRLRMLQGEKLPFVEEARGLFGVEVPLRPLSEYDPILREIEALVPGPGPLWQRVDALGKASEMDESVLRPVFERAIAECRARTLPHIALPPGETFTLAFVTGKSWGGYNWYKGSYRSLIEVNTDLPVRADRALDLGCHEGYPGHHVYNSLIEQKLVRGRGWVEYSVYPLFSPQSLIAEGSANYGVELAFPGDEKPAFEAAEIYPRAGLDPALAVKIDRLGELMKQLSQARNTIVADYLDGRIGKAEAIDRVQRYSLVNADRAAKLVAFAEQYRSYVINYNLGLDMVRAHVERVGGDDRDARWRAFAEILSQPTLPEDLVE